MDTGLQAGLQDTRLNLLNIPIGRPFFETFVTSLMDGEIVPAINRSTDPLAFADATIFVPTRRSGRVLAQMLAEALGPRPAILPRIVPLGDPANLDDRSIISGETISGLDGLDPAVPPLRRRLELMRLVEHWRVAVRDSLSRDDHGNGALLSPDDLFQVASSPADAFGLAGDLAALIDEMTIEGIDWSKLDGLVLGHDQYWDITTQFLMIAGSAWPAWLKEEGLCDEAARRKTLFEREAARLIADRPATPMIVAGSTGSQPATAALMHAIAMLPNGAVILPGLDQHLDDESWAAIATTGPDVARGLSSPQAIMKRLLDLRMGVPRSAVRTLGGVDAVSSARAMLMSETLRPAETTDRWAVPQEESARAAEDRIVTTAFEGLSIIEAADEREEALAIAIRMREVLREPEKTVALVTPDRPLGIRVAAELARFGIDVDDSAGRPLSQTPRGIIAHHALEVAEKDFEPCSVLGLLHHEHLRLGLPRTEIDAMLAVFDIALMRNGPIDPGMDGLRKAAAEALELARGRRAPGPQRRLAASLGRLMEQLFLRLEQALGPLVRAIKDHRCSLQRLARLHVEALEKLTLVDGAHFSCFDEEDGETLEKIFEALLGDEDAPSRHGRGHDGKGFAVETYLPLFDALLTGETVRLRSVSHRRLRIYGPLEARLLETDVTILGGLNEGTWPPVTQTDAFLNRPMRAVMGLSPPERRIGQSAHDFAMLMGGREVVIARAARVDGAPTVASRFLRRLKAYAGEAHWKGAVARGERYTRFARRMDELPEGTPASPVARPEPRPALALRPRSLSITEIETLYRDPYAIFARHVLKLDPLGERLPVPGYAERGQIIHDALAEFVERYPRELPEQPVHALMEIGRRAFSRYLHHLDVETFWWPRFLNIATWFVDWESMRRLEGLTPMVELAGKLEFKLQDGSTFTLRGRADRIELRSDASFAVVDYKTGTPPGNKEVLRGLNPQLTLEAAMVQAGAFPAIGPQRSVTQMLYVKLSGSEGEAGKETNIKSDLGSLDDLAALHLARLKTHLNGYCSLEKGYLSRRFPKKTTYANPYDHLARVLEWSETGDEPIEGADA